MEATTIVSKQLLRGVLGMFMLSLFSIGAYAQNGPNHITRANYLAMSPAQQKIVLNNYVDYTIDDLINYTSSLSQSRNSFIWMMDAQFTAASVQKKHTALKNPTVYIIVNDPNHIPLITITQTYFDSLSKEKQIEIKNSGQYVIVP